MKIRYQDVKRFGAALWNRSEVALCEAPLRAFASFQKSTGSSVNSGFGTTDNGLVCPTPFVRPPAPRASPAFPLFSHRHAFRLDLKPFVPRNAAGGCDIRPGDTPGEASLSDCWEH